jgi:hypothetical protein
MMPSMPRRILSLLCLLLLLPLPRAGARDIEAGRSSWDRLQQLRPGDSIQVKRRGAGSIRVTFEAVTVERLHALTAGNQPIDIGHADVLRVYRLRRRSGAQTAAPAIGAAVGFGIGFGIGYGVTGSKCNTEFCIGPFVSRPVAGAVVGVIGALIGGVVGFIAKGKSRDLIYQATV